MNLMGLKIVGGRYKIIKRLAAGGFGMTFLAEDQHLPNNHPCVVKQLKPQSTDAKTLEIARRLFNTEAKVLHKLGNHQKIPQLFAFFEENNEFYLVQEYIHGHPLSDELKLSKRWNEAETINLLKEILEILEFVHHENVIHRDVNPRNILRDENDGRLFLIDFGAVKEITTQILLTTPGQTALSVIIGTPGYMPSEQANGHPKMSSDIYAVGMIGIQALTGLSPEQLTKNNDTAEIIWQNKVSVSPEFAQVLSTMVRYDFRERYPSAVEALAAINALQDSGIPLSLAKTKIALTKIRKNRNIFWSINIILGIFLLLILRTAFSGAKFWQESQTASQLYEQGRVLSSLNRYEEALDKYRKAARIQWNHVDTWIKIGDMEYQLEDYNKSLEAYDRAIQINPTNDEPNIIINAWIGRGMVLDKQENFPAALNSFMKAVQLDQKSYKAWQGQGEVLFKLQRYEEAIAAYEKTLKLNQNSYDAWYNMGKSYAQLQDYKNAEKAYKKAVEIQPDQSSAWDDLANISFQLENYEEAIKAYDKSLRFAPENAPENGNVWYRRGNAFLKWRKPAEAIASYEKALEFFKASENPDLLYNLALALHELRRYTEAIERYNQLLTIRPQDYQVWYNRGNAENALERYSDAIKSYEQAVFIKQDYYEAWYALGNVQFTLQRYPNAIASYDKALFYAPNYKPARDAKKQAEKELEKK